MAIQVAAPALIKNSITISEILSEMPYW